MYPRAVKRTLWLADHFSPRLLAHPDGARISVSTLSEETYGPHIPVRVAEVMDMQLETADANKRFEPGDTVLVREPLLESSGTYFVVEVQGSEPAGQKAAEPVEAPPALVAPSSDPADAILRARLVKELTKAVAWNELDQARLARAALLERFPGSKADADAAERDGAEQRAAVTKLEELARRGVDRTAFAEWATEVTKRWPFLKGKVGRVREHARVKAANAAQSRLLAQQKKPLSMVRRQRDPRVLALKPDGAWKVVIDETGTQFASNSLAGTKGAEGRFVAVAIPSRTKLEALPASFHASKQGDSTLDDRLQYLLDADVGVLGVSLRDLPHAPGDRWSDGVLELVDWLLLLLPRNRGEPFRLDVCVEQRGGFNNLTNWDLAVRELTRRVAARDPERADRLRLQIRTCAKGEEPLLAYADLVAHTWFAGTAASRERLQASELQGRCLLEGSALALRKLWDEFGYERTLSARSWAALLDTPACDDPESIAGLLSERLATLAEEAPALWQAYLTEAMSHLESKAVDLARVGRQLGWLASSAPSGEKLPPRARHAWAQARLAQANHLGRTSVSEEREIEELGEALLDECAPMVCDGDLHRAVVATNRFDFAGATAALARWRDVDVRIPGLRMWACVRSSLGQHLAFEGRYAEARASFDAALEAFGRLSDPRVAAGDSAQTGTYRAIATMDDPAATDAEAKAALEGVLGPVDAAVARVGTSTASADKYAVHLLLRWAVHRGDEAVRAALLAQAPQWDVGEGHPWQLVCFYRALLLQNAHRSDEARAWLRTGVNVAWAASQGPTVRFIGLVLATVLAALGDRDPRVDDAIELARRELPAAAQKLARVEHELAHPGDALAFVREVLPNHFR
jgi:hypothetical protein